MWRGLRWVSGIREWEQATQTRVIGCCLTCLPCRNELIYLSLWKKRWVGRVGGNFIVENYYGILSRNFKYSCTDCIVHVWLSCIDCGCLESATRMGNDSDPAPQTNLGLTSLYSLFFSYLNRNRICGLTTHRYDFCIWFFCFKGSTCRGVYMGSMLVAHHFLSRDFALGFSNSIPMYTL